MSQKICFKLQAISAKVAAVFFWTAVSISCFTGQAFANNLSLSNAALTSPNTTEGTTQVQFDISWSNSWRNTINYDAAWVFVKYSTDSGTSWSHATLKKYGTTPTGFSTGSGTAIEIVVPSDKKGAFIQRSGSGSGPLSTTSIQLVWDYSGDGVSNSATVRVKVVGIEMAYIPTASFYLGDGNGSVESSRAFHVTDNTYLTISTVSVASVTVDSNVDDDIDTSPISIDGDGGITGNASFPTGYVAFYLMKYEVTEGQWVDFFNTLTTLQKTTRDITSSTSGGKNSDSVVDRNTVAWTSGDATTARNDRACGYLSWADGCALLDWAGLRPFTELEYEKTARGDQQAVNGEFAWGSTSITAAATIFGTENGTETITTSGANNVFNSQTYNGGDGSAGPLRSGIFATSTTTRILSGAGYYGNMELSGNLYERTVTVGNSGGRAFTGTHGDGILTTTSSYEGNATNTDWPGIDGTVSRGVTGTTVGYGYKGGIWNDSSTSAWTVSARSSAASANSGRGNNRGCRGARTAP